MLPWVGPDGKSDIYTDQQRAERVVELIGAGFRDQILLSLDYGQRSLMTGCGWVTRSRYLSEWFMVLLMEVGLDAMTIRGWSSMTLQGVDDPSDEVTPAPKWAVYTL